MLGFYSRVLFGWINRGTGSPLAIEWPLDNPWIAPTRPDFTMSARSDLNAKLAKAWLSANGNPPPVPRVTAQIATVPLDLSKLHKFAYNASIARHDGKIYLAYRYHESGPQTKIALAELNGDFKVKSRFEVPLNGQSVEDPRLFINEKGELCMTWVESVLDKLPYTCKVWQCVLDITERRVQPIFVIDPFITLYPQPRSEKNWCVWENKTIYSSSPMQVIHWNGYKYECPGAWWPYGQIKGGTSSTPYKGKLIRFFHSTLDNEPEGAHSRRYFMGAMLMEPEPPFAPIAVSKQPIVTGSEADDMSDLERASCFHHKQRVVFPAGAIEFDDGWVVSAGINDSAIALLHILEKDLHL